MNDHLPARFYAIAFAALALSIAAFVLSLQNDDPGLAAAAGGISALGFIACVWMLKRER
jgi:hypothetical protein